MKFFAGSCLILAACTGVGAETVRLNELLANAPAGWLELANPTDQLVDLAGWEIRVSSGTNPLTWTLGPDSAIGPGDFWLLPEQLTQLRFPATGGRIELRAADGTLVDALEYGPQLPRESVGRTGNEWVLQAEPSPGHANGAAASLGQLGDVRLNEWRFGTATDAGWLELHNRAALPVNLAGAQLVQTHDGVIHRFRFAPLSWVEPFGWPTFSADAGRPPGFGNLGFTLTGGSGAISLLGPDGETLDQVSTELFRNGFTSGRLPDGGPFVAVLSMATPGAANQSEFDTDGDGMTDGWEARFGLDPADPDDGVTDSDGDGLSNREEFQAGRNPRTADAPLPVTTELLADGQLRLRFSASAGISYSVLAGAAPDALFELFVPFIADGPARTVEVTDRPESARFYRIVSPARATSPAPGLVPGISRR
jgi:hypothetical protein